MVVKLVERMLVGLMVSMKMRASIVVRMVLGVMMVVMMRIVVRLVVGMKMVVMMNVKMVVRLNDGL